MTVSLKNFSVNCVLATRYMAASVKQLPTLKNLTNTTT